MTSSSGGQTPGTSANGATLPNPPSSTAQHQGRAANSNNPNAKSAPKASDIDRRKERNAREKERSCRIAKQIDDLRTLLSRGGVIVSKGTKSSVLSEAANYINLLQQQQVQWEMYVLQICFQLLLPPAQ